MSLSEQLGLLGRKVGMMRIFTDDGDAIPVTVLDVSNNRVTQIKTPQTDGYSAVLAGDTLHSTAITALRTRLVDRRRARVPRRRPRRG